MQALRLPFKLLSLAGVWMPVKWDHPKFVWIIYSFVTTGFIVVQFITQVGRLLGARNVNEFNERLFLIPTSISSLHKISTFILYRKEVINLIKMLFEDYCIPRTAEEVMIDEKYEEIIRIVTLTCFALVNVTMMNLISWPLVTSNDEPTLPFKVWLPYSIDSKVNYWLSYLHQSLGVIFSGIGLVGGTLMINGFLYKICGQFEILSHRFHKLPELVNHLQSLNKPPKLIHHLERKAMRQNVEHHLYIYKLAKGLNDTFKSVIFQQFIMSAIVIAVSIYQISTRKEKDMEFVMSFLYLMCVLTEFLMYSWFSNEIMVESLNFRNSIYSINWTALSTTCSRDLVLVMLRTSKPIMIYCGHFIVMSLASYINILKTSYSVFNVLREST